MTPSDNPPTGQHLVPRTDAGARKLIERVDRAIAKVDKAIGDQAVREQLLEERMKRLAPRSWVLMTIGAASAGILAAFGIMAARAEDGANSHLEKHEQEHKAELQTITQEIREQKADNRKLDTKVDRVLFMLGDGRRGRTQPASGGAP